MPIALGFQRELAMLSSLMSGTRCALGRIGEMFVKVALEANGYLADILPERGAGDIRAVAPDGQVVRVEVKTARLSKCGYFQFILKKKYKNGTFKTDCSNCDVVICLCVFPSKRVEIYVIPYSEVRNLTIVKIPKNIDISKSIWRKYRQRLQTLTLNEVRDTYAVRAS